jgi:hypothetical protein
MKRNYEKHSKVMVIANSLVKRGMGRSSALSKAWAFVKMGAVGTKAAGVTYGKRQKALERLAAYPASMASLALAREPGNMRDASAVAVVASVEGKGSYTIGYVPRALAAFIAPLMDAGKPVQARYREVTGGFSPLAYRGIAFDVAA